MTAQEKKDNAKMKADAKEMLKKLKANLPLIPKEPGKI